MKKQIALLITITLCVGNIAFAADYSNVGSAFPYLQDFENSKWVTTTLDIGESRSLLANNPDGWIAQNYVKDNLWMYLTRFEEEHINHAFELRAVENAVGIDGKKHQGYVQFTAPEYGGELLSVEFDIMTTNTNMNKKIYLRNQAASWNAPLILNSSGTYSVGGIATNISYPLNEWVNVKFVLNNEHDKGVVYIDGERVGGVFTFDFTSLQFIYFELEGKDGKAAESFFFDNVKVENTTIPNDSFQLMDSTPSNGSTLVDPATSSMEVRYNSDIIVNPSITINGETLAPENVVLSRSKTLFITLPPMENNTAYTISFSNAVDVYGRTSSNEVSFTTSEADKVYSPTRDSLPFRQTFQEAPWVEKAGILGEGESFSLGAHNPMDWKAQNYDSGNSNQLWQYLTGADGERGHVFELRATNVKVKKNLQAYLEFPYTLPNISQYSSEFLSVSTKVMPADLNYIKKIQIRGNTPTNGATSFLDAVTFETTGYLTVGGNKTDVAYTPGKWMDVKILIHQASRKFFVKIDGEYLKATGTLPNNWNNLRFIYFGLNSEATGKSDSFYFDDVTIEVEQDINNNSLIGTQCKPVENASGIDPTTEITLTFSKPLLMSPDPSQFSINEHYSWVKRIIFSEEKPTQVILIPYCMAPNSEIMVVFEDIADIDGGIVSGNLKFNTATSTAGFAFSKVVFMSDNTEISTIKNGQISAKLTAFNNSDDENGFFFILALYKGEQLESVTIEPYDLSAHSYDDDVQASITVPDDEGDYSIKAMMWNKTNTIQPYSVYSSLNKN